MNTKKKSMFLYLAKSLVLLLFVLGSVQGAAVYANDDLDLFIGQFGRPDRIKVSGIGTADASKQLIYVSENVRVLFVPGSLPDSRASVPRWKLKALYDLRTNRQLSGGEAARRLKQRKIR